MPALRHSERLARRGAERGQLFTISQSPPVYLSGCCCSRLRPRATRQAARRSARHPVCAGSPPDGSANHKSSGRAGHVIARSSVHVGSDVLFSDNGDAFRVNPHVDSVVGKRMLARCSNCGRNEQGRSATRAAVFHKPNGRPAASGRCPCSPRHRRWIRAGCDGKALPTASCTLLEADVHIRKRDKTRCRLPQPMPCVLHVLLHLPLLSWERC